MDKIAERIKKLLALSKSPVEAEAISALNLAHKLAIEYNLDLSSITTEKSDIEESVYFKGKRWHNWKVTLLNAIARVNFGRVITYNTHGHHIIHEFTIIAKPHNVLIISGIADYLFSTISRLSKQKNFGSRMYTESYQVGLAHTLVNRLSELKKEDMNTAGIKDLVIVSDSELEQYMKDLGTKTKKQKNTEVKSHGAYIMGIKDGNDIALNAQLKGSYQTNSFKALT